MITRKTESAKLFFGQFTISHRLLVWVAFKTWVMQPSRKTLEITADDPEALLQTWYAQTAMSTQLLNWRRMMFSASFFAGGLAMLSFLAVSFERAINVWAPIAVFALLPLVFSGLTMVRFFQSKNHLPGWIVLLNRFHTLESWRTNARLIVPWLVVQFQWTTLLFLSGGLVGFLLLGVFQSITFGWSSTFIQDSSTMAEVIKTISFPWQWFVPVPTVEALEALRVNELGRLSDSHSATLLPTVFMAVVFYGALPKLIIVALYASRLRNRLREEITESSFVEQFLNEHFHQATLNPLPAEESGESVSEISINFDQQEFIGWQLHNIDLPLSHNLGRGSWTDDQAFIEAFQPIASKQLFVAVQRAQTPTGELADCLSLIRRRGLSVSLFVLSRSHHLSRRTDDLVSWQAFAQQNGVEIFQESADD